MIQPGKYYGLWTVGQEVRTVAGAVFIGVNSFDVDEIGEVPDYGWARNAASDVARSVLGNRPGTVAWATVDREGRVAVFGDFGGTEIMSDYDSNVIPDRILARQLLRNACQRQIFNSYGGAPLDMRRAVRTAAPTTAAT